MRGRNWTDAENDLIVADYFAMLKAAWAGETPRKTDSLSALRPQLNDRSEGSIEFKHQNISAVLRDLGEEWIKGYVPLDNYQESLVDAVARWLARDHGWLERGLDAHEAGNRFREPKFDWQGAHSHDLLDVAMTPPTLANSPPPKNLEQTLRTARKFDVAGRDARNRALGRAGEERVLRHERARLHAEGRADLAGKVRWVADEEGDGLGYDIASFEPDGRDRLIEVKTTRGWERTPFFLTRNELDVAQARADTWCLFRLYEFPRSPRAFELRPPLERHVSLIATGWEARFDRAGPAVGA